MVNYLYELDDIEANHEAFADRGEIITSGDVRQWMKRKGPLRATPEAAAG
jgi:malonyl-CoA decarboxylase